MGVNMVKGQTLSLTKQVEGMGISLDDVVVACGWDVKKQGSFLNRGPGYDLDLSAAMLDDSGRVPDNYDPTDKEPGCWQNGHIWANHRVDADKSVIFGGDNRNGKGNGDDETMTVTLSSVPAKIQKIIFSVVIWQARERGGQTFGQVENAFIRVFDKRTGVEFARYNLTDEFADETLVMFGELYRHNGDWKFRAVGQGYNAVTYRQLFNIKKPFETDYARYRN